MPRRINEFRDTSGTTDRARWREDIIGWLLQRTEDGITTRELCREYFGDTRIETKLRVSVEMQIVRAILLDRGLFLLSNARRWFLVPHEDSARARQLIVNRARRLAKSYERLGTLVEMGKQNYALPESDQLLRAIEGNEQTMRQLRATLDSDNDADADQRQRDVS